MKMVDLICPHCGAVLKAGEESGEFICEYCGAKITVDNETIHIKYDNPEEAGYQFEKGRQRAMEESAAGTYGTSGSQYAQKKKRHTFLWVMGWIIIFPVPLMILVLRSKTMKTGVKIGIIAAGWILYIIIMVASANSEDSSGYAMSDVSTASAAETVKTGNAGSFESC